MLFIQVISLNTATERRQHCTQEFGKQRIEFTFFDAITPDLIGSTCQKLGIDLINNQRLSQGEKACFLSHLSLWQKMIDENLDYLAIFEDDVCLGEHADLFLTLDWLKNFDCDIIKLETWQELVHLKNTPFCIHERTLYQLKSTHVGACGYIISQHGAKYAIDYTKSLPSDYIFAIDHVIFGALLDKLTIYQVSPALCIQADRHSHQLASQLEHQRQNNSMAYKASDGFIGQCKKLIKRLIRSIGKRTFYKKVRFR